MGAGDLAAHLAVCLGLLLQSDALHDLISTEELAGPVLDLLLAAAQHSAAYLQASLLQRYGRNTADITICMFR